MITINNLSFSYDNSPFLQHVNLHIGKGCFCAVMGPNGSGKSTLLKLMVNLLVPNSGEILVSGKPLHDYSQRELANEIIKLYNEGLSEIEIAKQMGKGLGEVKLVLGLFNGGKES